MIKTYYFNKAEDAATTIRRSIAAFKNELNTTPTVALVSRANFRDVIDKANASGNRMHLDDLSDIKFMGLMLWPDDSCSDDDRLQLMAGSNWNRDYFDQEYKAHLEEEARVQYEGEAKRHKDAMIARLVDVSVALQLRVEEADAVTRAVLLNIIAELDWEVEVRTSESRMSKVQQFPVGATQAIADFLADRDDAPLDVKAAKDKQVEDSARKAVENMDRFRENVLNTVPPNSIKIGGTMNLPQSYPQVTVDDGLLSQIAAPVADSIRRDMYGDVPSQFMRDFMEWKKHQQAMKTTKEILWP